MRIGLHDVHFDHEAICDQTSGLPHTLPSAEEFKGHMVRLGIQKNHQIICYDCHKLGLFGAPRCAWMLKYFGATNVRILNGGLKKWMAEGRPVIENTPTEKTTYNESDGDYSYGVANADSCILAVAEMHKLAGKLYHLSSPAEADF